MSNVWTDEQREVLSRKQAELLDLKTRLLPKEEVTPRQPVSQVSQRQKYRSHQRFGFGCLVAYNVMFLLGTTIHACTVPDSASLFLDADHVRPVSGEENAIDSYVVDVPLKEFPFEAQLHRFDRFELMSGAAVNLLLLGAIGHAYWKESQLSSEDASD